MLSNLSETLDQFLADNPDADAERKSVVAWLRNMRELTAAEKDRHVLAAFTTDQGEYIMQLSVKKPAIRVLCDKEPVQTFKLECCPNCLFRASILRMISHHASMQSIAANPGKPNAASPWAKG